MLTTVTTIVGLLPLLLETNRNAQFLIPMAITLVFGLVAVTLLVLILMPELAGLGHDLAGIVRAAPRMSIHTPRSNPRD